MKWWRMLLGLKYRVTTAQTVSISYGLHEKISMYAFPLSSTKCPVMDDVVII
jgi:hypothetical protein